MKMWKGWILKPRTGTVYMYFVLFFPVFLLKAILFHKLKNLNLGISKLIMKFTHNKPEDNRVFHSIPFPVLVTIFVYMGEW